MFQIFLKIENETNGLNLLKTLLLKPNQNQQDTCLSQRGVLLNSKLNKKGDL